MSTKDQLLSVALHGTAMRYAAERRNLADSIVELRQMAGGRNDILAEAEGITEDTSAQSHRLIVRCKWKRRNLYTGASIFVTVGSRTVHHLGNSPALAFQEYDP